MDVLDVVGDLRRRPVVARHPEVPRLVADGIVYHEIVGVTDQPRDRPRDDPILGVGGEFGFGIDPLEQARDLRHRVHQFGVQYFLGLVQSVRIERVELGFRPGHTR